MFHNLQSSGLQKLTFGWTHKHVLHFQSRRKAVYCPVVFVFDVENDPKSRLYVWVYSICNLCALSDLHNNDALDLHSP